MYKNSSAPLNNTALWHYLGKKHLEFRHENNSTPGILIKEIRYTEICRYIHKPYSKTTLASHIV